jgi:hypothetical protein
MPTQQIYGAEPVAAEPVAAAEPVPVAEPVAEPDPPPALAFERSISAFISASVIFGVIVSYGVGISTLPGLGIDFDAPELPLPSMSVTKLETESAQGFASTTTPISVTSVMPIRNSCGPDHFIPRPRGSFGTGSSILLSALTPLS